MPTPTPTTDRSSSCWLARDDDGHVVDSNLLVLCSTARLLGLPQANFSRLSPPRPLSSPFLLRLPPPPSSSLTAGRCSSLAAQSSVLEACTSPSPPPIVEFPLPPSPTLIVSSFPRETKSIFLQSRDETRRNNTDKISRGPCPPPTIRSIDYRDSRHSVALDLERRTPWTPRAAFSPRGT